MKKVLVTGATGFIGRHCLPLLVKKGYEVHAVSSRTLSLGHDTIKWHTVNLLEPSKVSKLVADVRPTHLLHLAWFVSPKEYWDSLENLRWVQASIDLFRAFAQRGGRRLVTAGTCAEYDWRYGYCSEQVTPLGPATLYGISKLSLWMLTEALANQTGVRASWARIFFIYGPHEHPSRLIPSIIRHYLSHKKRVFLMHGNHTRDFLHISDAADALVGILESDATGSINVGSGLPVSFAELISIVARKLDRHGFSKVNMAPSNANDSPFLVADISRLTHQLNWQPKYNLDRGLEQTISWWHDRL